MSRSRSRLVRTTWYHIRVFEVQLTTVEEEPFVFTANDTHRQRQNICKINIFKKLLLSDVRLRQMSVFSWDNRQTNAVSGSNSRGTVAYIRVRQTSISELDTNTICVWFSFFENHILERSTMDLTCFLNAACSQNRIKG